MYLTSLSLLFVPGAVVTKHRPAPAECVILAGDGGYPVNNSRKLSLFADLEEKRKRSVEKNTGERSVALEFLLVKF